MKRKLLRTAVTFLLIVGAFGLTACSRTDESGTYHAYHMSGNNHSGMMRSDHSSAAHYDHRGMSGYNHSDTMGYDRSGMMGYGQ